MNGNVPDVLEPMNPWENVYWFARMLISTDKYGAPGKNKHKMLEMLAGISQVLDDGSVDDALKLDICKSTIINLFTNSTSKMRSVKNIAFAQDICEKLHSIKDVMVLLLTIKNVVLPINLAMQSVPNSDIEFTEGIAKAYLDSMGVKGLASVINLWDDAGVNGCLSAERALVKQAFAGIRSAAEFLDQDSADWVLTAFIQEFERRLGQKRKARAGGSLENVTSFLFDYYGLAAHDKPEHFKTDIEVDKWILCKDKWLIGISCKRTLRERWKQVSSADRSVLSSFKIKQLWHLITFDADLSDDKVAALGAQNHVFYLKDDSIRLEHYLNHSVMKDFVRPMSAFIDDIKKEQGVL